MIECVSEDSVPDWAAIEAIYLSSFPPEERERFETVFLEDRGQRIWVATGDAGTPLAVAVVVWLAQREVGLLEYIATAEWARSSGIGRALLDAIATAAQAEGKTRILLEVDDPSHVTDKAIAERRIRFYERWGARRVACLRRYFIPNFTDPRKAVPMILLDRPLIPAADLTGDALRVVLEDIYRCEYGHVNGGEHLTRLLDEISC
jgi:ribosomal protein S18 acetylase RimI-like enzyme